MTQKDCQIESTKADTVAMGSFGIDSHIVGRSVDDEGNVMDEGAFPFIVIKPYEVPYRCLTPRRSEPVYAAPGQASGVAAEMSIDGGQAVQAIDISALQSKLRQQKGLLELKR